MEPLDDNVDHVRGVVGRVIVEYGDDDPTALLNALSG
jgi:hypothetical protein